MDRAPVFCLCNGQQLAMGSLDRASPPPRQPTTVPPVTMVGRANRDPDHLLRALAFTTCTVLYKFPLFTPPHIHPLFHSFIVLLPPFLIHLSPFLLLPFHSVSYSFPFIPHPASAMNYFSSSIHSYPQLPLSLSRSRHRLLVVTLIRIMSGKLLLQTSGFR
jgi:hypothetical protein